MIQNRFKAALKLMLADGEYQKCIDNAGYFEKKRLIKFRELLNKSGDIEKVPIWALLYEIRSMILLKDIIAYMIKLDS